MLSTLGRVCRFPSRTLLPLRHYSTQRPRGQQTREKFTTADLPFYVRLFAKKEEDKKEKDKEDKDDELLDQLLSKTSKKDKDKDEGGGGDRGNDGFWGKLGLYFVFLAAVGGIIYLLTWESATEISYLHFQNSLLAMGYVEYIEVINKSKALVYLKGQKGEQFFFNISSVPAFEKELYESVRKLGGYDDLIPIRYTEKTDFLLGYIRALPILALIGFLGVSFLSFANSMKGGGGGIFKMVKSKHQLWGKGKKISVKFSDVAGCDEAKQEITEFVSFLTSPKRYEALGAKIPKGAILVGPPGTGKTLLAKATAGEAEVPFFSVSGSDFVEIYGGVGPARVRDLFKDARASAPCIIFIDEIDAIGRKRGATLRNEERENTLNQLLVEMDGFTSNKGIVVLAGTNRADILDPALTRPGRFDRTISIDLPDVQSREAVFKVHLKAIKLSNQLIFDDLAKRLAALTPGFSGADISNVCNEAAIIAARRNKEEVTQEDFEAAIDRVIAGLEKKSKILSPKEKQVVAYHEAGHALAGWLLPFADPVLKVSIIPRGSAALGFSQQLPEEKHLYSQEYIHSRIGVLLAGRAAEQLKFGEITSGAQDDLQKVSRLAYDEILTYGMNDLVGSVSFTENNSAYAGKPYSENTAQLVDDQASQRVRKIYDDVLTLLRDNMEKLEMIANILMTKELIHHDEIRDMLGPPVSRSSPEHEVYLSSKAWTQPTRTESMVQEVEHQSTKE